MAALVGGAGGALEGGAAPLGSALSRVTVADLVAKKAPLVDAEESTSVGTVLRTLNGLHVLALPLYRRRREGEAAHAGDRVYTGIVSALDCVSFALRAAAAADARTTGTSGTKVLPSVVGRSTQAVPAHLNEPASKAIGATSESARLEVVPLDATVLSVMHTFSSVHRAIVPPNAAGGEPSKGGGAKILSQFDILHYFLEHRHLSPVVDALFDTCLSDVPKNVLVPKTVVTARDTADLVTELYAMIDKNTYAVAVVDAHGRLVATLSMSDLRGVVTEKLPVLEGTSVENFAKFFQGDDPAQNQVRFTNAATLGDILQTLLEAQIHRAWIVDSDDRPVDVLSYTDFIRLLWRLELQS